MLKSLNAGELTPGKDIENRIEGLRKRMEANGVGFSVILQNVDLLYFTGSLQKGILIVPLEADPIFFVEKTIERARFETPLTITPIGREKEVKGILADRNILSGQGGMELDVIPVALYDRWRAILGCEGFADISSLIRDIRQVKSPFEIDQIRKSGEIVSHVFGKARDVISEGRREIDVAADLEGEGRRFGHHGFLRMRGLNQEMMNIYITHGYSATLSSHADVPISGIGLTHAIPQGPSIQRFSRNIPILIDYGGGFNGYITDETRVFVLGEMKDVFRKGYEVARQIIEDAAVFGREGVNGTELFLRASDAAERAGLGDYFMGYGGGRVGFVGHGLGLEINELPVITPRHSVILKEGMVFAFEPKFILPGEGAIGIEVDFIVRKDRLERVTDTSVDVVYL
jgi:Xaa-Pro dipeptidase